MKRVIGIGNALTDMLVNLKDEEVLERYNIARGSMSLVDSKLQSDVSKAVAGRPYSLSLGGSADNTIRAMAHLGSDVGFIGKVGKDTTGDFFEQALENLGIKPVIFRGVKVGKNTVVRNSILFQDTFTGENVILDNVITDKNVVIRDNRVLSGAEDLPYYIPKGKMI